MSQSGSYEKAVSTQNHHLTLGQLTALGISRGIAITEREEGGKETLTVEADSFGDVGAVRER